MRYLDAVACRPLERPPIWLMRQAGRYLPEYREVRTRFGFQESVARADVAAELTLQPITRFGMDAAIIFADIMTPLEAMGVDMTFDPGPVLARPVRNAADLSPLDPATGVGATLDALGIVRRDLPAECALIGFCGAPYTLAAYLVDGGGSKDFLGVRSMAADPTSGLGALLDVLADAMGDYLAAQVQAGADAVQIFDSWVGTASLATFRALLAPNLERLIERVRSHGVHAPITYFAPHGPHLLDAVGTLDVNVVGLDWRLPVSAARARLGRDVAVQGNLDPAVLLAGPEVTAAATRAMLMDATAAPGYIVNVGHGLTPKTPVESVAALVDVVQNWSAP